MKINFVLHGELEVDPDTFNKNIAWTKEEMVRFEMSRFGDALNILSVFTPTTPDPITDGPVQIQIPEWAGHGTGMLRRRSGLPASHPESEYNYVLANYPGVNPEDYGIKPPDREPCPRCGRR